MSDRKSTLTAILVDGVSGPAHKIQGEITGIGEAATRVSSVLTGIGLGIGEKLFEGFSLIVSRLSDIIPSLIAKGNDYLEQLRTIQLETGMTAEETSLLTGAMSSLGIPVARIEPLLARFSKQLEGNEGKFRALGVATRDSNGHMLDASQIITNLRHAVQQHGESLLSTAAAQELFGKSGSELLPYLHKTDEEIDSLNKNTARWGGILSQQAISGAEAFKVALASLGQGVTDIGANIAAALDPYLEQFIDAFSRFVQAHLNDIVNFVVGVANAIIGFISGLFGITDALTATDNSVTKTTKNVGEFTAQTHKAAGAEDEFTKSINAQIAAIDAHTHAIEEAEQRRHAARERERLHQSITDARSQLKDLQGNAPFLGGLSAAEQVLAVQKHAQDIIDAKKKVSDAEQSLGDFEADQKDRAERELLNREKDRLRQSLAAHRAANAAILDSGLQMAKGLDLDVGGAFEGIRLKTEQFGATAAASFKGGVDAARAFLDILLGSEQAVTGVGGGPEGVARSGGVIGAIGGVADALGGLPGIFDKVKIAVGILIGIMVLQGAASFLGALGTIGGGIATLALALGPTGALALAIIGILGLLALLAQKAIKVDEKTGGLFQYPQIPGDHNNNMSPGGFTYPGGATGAFVPAQPGGVIMRIGEGAEDEWVLTRSQLAGMHAQSGGDAHSHDIYMDGRKVAEAVSGRLAFSLNHSPVTSLPSGSF